MTKHTVTSLSLNEQETTIVRTRTDEVTTIESTVPRDIGRLRRHPAFTEVASGKWGRTEWARFTIASDQWNPATGAKRKTRPLTPEERAVAGARLRAASAERRRSATGSASPGDSPTPDGNAAQPGTATEDGAA